MGPSRPQIPLDHEPIRPLNVNTESGARNEDVDEEVNSEVEGSCSEIDDVEQEKADAEWEKADREYEKRKNVEGTTGSDGEHDEARNARIRRRMMKKIDEHDE